MLYLCFFKPLRHYLRGFLIAAWAGDKIAEFSFPEISFHFPLRPWFFFVSPAYAGKSTTAGRGRMPFRDHPRVCGEKNGCWGVNLNGTGSPPRMREKLTNLFLVVSQIGSPPRMRGKVLQPPVFLQPLGITPAYAGKRVLRVLLRLFRGDHPRVCGEKVRYTISFETALGSPPRMRGKDTDIPLKANEDGITPAYAGKRK